LGRPGGADVARQPRLTVAGELHHVLLRGHNGQSVFADDADRAAFVELLREPAARQGVAIHAYALLASEVHLLATPAEAESLARLMQSIGRRYVALFNRRQARRGTLWDGRFRTSLLDSQTLLLPAMLHVEALPARAGLVAAAEDSPWSSGAHHTGRRRDPLITEHALYWRLGNTPFEREHAHTVALRSAQQGAEDLRFGLALAKGQALGPAGFVHRMAESLGRTLVSRPRGRPVGRAMNKSVPN
jgi:putative transposase